VGLIRGVSLPIRPRPSNAKRDINGRLAASSLTKRYASQHGKPDQFTELQWGQRNQLIMEERRQSPRQRTYKGGRINADRAGSLDCIVRNISETGACLEISSDLIAANQFNLVIMPEFLVRRCQVAWRKPQKMGVRFI
jgi:hypothetical protein